MCRMLRQRRRSGEAAVPASVRAAFFDSLDMTLFARMALLKSKPAAGAPMCALVPHHLGPICAELGRLSAERGPMLT